HQTKGSGFSNALHSPAYLRSDRDRYIFPILLYVWRAPLSASRSSQCPLRRGLEARPLKSTSQIRKYREWLQFFSVSLQNTGAPPPSRPLRKVLSFYILRRDSLKIPHSFQSHSSGRRLLSIAEKGRSVKAKNVKRSKSYWELF